MRVLQVATAVTTDVSSAAVNPQITTFREGVFQTEFESDAGTGNVVLEGKLHPDAPWETIVTDTVSNAQTVALFPYMRVTTNTISGATINCWLQY